MILFFFRDSTKIRCPYDIIRTCITKIEYYYKNINPFEIIPQNQYNLTIDIDDLTIIGSTIMPGNFQIITPTENQTFYYSNIDSGIVEIPIKWSQSLRALGYIVNVFYSNNSEVTISYTLTDTTYSFIQDYERGLDRKGKFRIEILAFDRNYYDHVIKNLPSAGLKGAYGYFGSSVLKTVTVNIE